VQLALPEPGAVVQSPSDGLIVRWRIRQASNSPGYVLRVLRPDGAGGFTAIGASAPVTPAGPGLETFDAQLRIHAGDYLGLDLPENGMVGVSSLGTYGFLGTALGENATGTPTEDPGEIFFNADVKPAPTITLISPPSGPTAGGTQVKVAGTDLTGATAVRFGTQAAPSFNVESDSRITAVSPAGASSGPVDVSVTTDVGTSAANPDDRFEYLTPTGSSSGCVVPNLKGKKLKAAKKRAKKAGCAVGKVKKAKGANASTGKVVSQSPKPGKAVAGGTRISVKLR
jgi:hypothetical protein